MTSKRLMYNLECGLGITDELSCNSANSSNAVISSISCTFDIHHGCHKIRVKEKMRLHAGKTEALLESNVMALLT